MLIFDIQGWDEKILSKLSVNKAIAWDGVTDSIFHKDLIDKTSTIFADL